MAELKIVSEVFKITSTIDDVYSFLSDFNRIGMVVKMCIRDRYSAGHTDLLRAFHRYKFLIIKRAFSN